IPKGIAHLFSGYKAEAGEIAAQVRQTSKGGDSHKNRGWPRGAGGARRQAVRRSLPRPFGCRTTLVRPTPRRPLHEQRGSAPGRQASLDRKSTRLNSSHVAISYAVFCLKKKKKKKIKHQQHTDRNKQ